MSFVKRGLVLDMSPRRVAAVLLALSALSAGPAAIVTATAADAATASYSVSVEYCSGGISATRYPTMHAAQVANARQMTRQRNHPGVLHSVQLRRSSKLIKSSTKACR